MAFALIPPATDCANPIALEQQLLAQARLPVAQLWQATPSLVVPRNYAQFTGFDAACARFAAQGWPVHVRPSGGGLVPLDTGVLNVSLAYPVSAHPGNAVELIYQHLCELLLAVLRPLGVYAHWAAVPGSFCDGRFNLAVGSGSNVRKIAGTAQYWRVRRAAPSTHTHYRVLAHALLLVAPDLAALHARANAFEALLGSHRAYATDRTTSIAAQVGSASGGSLMTTVRDRLQELIAAAAPPLA